MATLTVTTLDDETSGGGDLATETGDGAGLSLREALVLAQDGDSIVFDGSLAGGTLYLTEGELTLTQNDLTIDGDINGDDVADITISGDANGDDLTMTDGLGNLITDVANNTNTADNFRVFNITAGSTILDAIIITGGYATSTYNGAGVDIGAAQARIYNSVIAGNRGAGFASDGGGISNSYSGTLIIRDSHITNNQANQRGGGIENFGAAYLYGVTVSDNTTGGDYGGGIASLNSRGSLTIVDSIFSGNSVTSETTSSSTGGAILSRGELNVVRTTIENNTAGSGAGIATVTFGGYFEPDAITYISDSIISGNTTYGGGPNRGGGLSLSGTSTLSNSIISNNYASSDGGGIYLNGESTLLNVTVIGNTSENGDGGGISLKGRHFIYNSTITGNNAPNSPFNMGGGIMVNSYSNFRLFNSIVAGNETGGTGNDLAGSEYSLTANLYGVNIFGSAPVGFEYNGIDTADDIILGQGNAYGLTDVFETVAVNAYTGILSGAAADNGGPGETVAIKHRGVANDAGDIAALPTDASDLDNDMDTSESLPVDARGFDRSAGSNVDIGAFEFQGLVVTTNLDTGDDATVTGDLAAETADGDGLSLREALALAQDGETVTFDVSLSGMSILVGESGSGTLEISQNNIIIDGDLDNDGTADITLDGENDNRVVELSGGGTITLDGLRIYRGMTSDGNGGAGVLVNYGVTSHFNNVDIVDNTVSNGGIGYRDGGGIRLKSASTLNINGGSIVDNYATNQGGGIAVDDNSVVRIYDATIGGNYSTGNGGAISALNSSLLTIVNSAFIGNITAGSGGAVFANGANLDVVNSTFYGNVAQLDGGGISSTGSTSNIHNSTFTGNDAFSNGGGLQVNGNATVANTIFAGNNAFIGTEIWLAPTSTLNALGGNVFAQAGYAGANDIYTTDLAAIFSEIIANPISGVTGGRLRDNGGPVQKVMINPTGPAYNGGFAAALPVDIFDLDGDSNITEVLPFDSRGDVRIANGILDIGAVELEITTGSSGNNTIDGDGFAEVINGGAGNDTLRGLTGRDTVDGGAGKDLIFGNNDEDFIRGGTENDDLRGSLGDDTLYGDNGRDFLRGNGGDDDLRGGSGGDTLDGGLDNDELRGASGNDTLNGRLGNDFLSAGIDHDLLRAHEGDDTLIGGDGNDTMFGNPGNDTMSGGNGNDDLRGGNDNDSVSGGNDDDTLRGNSGNDSLLGNSGNDSLIGGSGNDDLRGGNDDDTLSGDDGNDTLRGNSGDDQFNFALGDDADQFIDFVAGAGSDDVISISGFGTAFDEFAEVQAVASDDGNGNTVIDFGGGDTITLNGVSAASLHEDDFVFV